MNLRQVQLVARFELSDALRSRLVLGVIALYGIGAGLGCYLFYQALSSAEIQVRESLLAGGATLAELPEDFVRSQALPRIIASVVEDKELATQLSAVDPLALFYAWGAFLFATPLALITSGGSHARDREHGTTRFLLTRTDSASWAFGKLLGHAALLGLGIALGACVTIAVAVWSGDMAGGTFGWLAMASVRAWVYAGGALCLFSSVSQVARSAARARAGCAVLLFGLWLGHTVLETRVGARDGELGSVWLWLFPRHYRDLLWSPNLGEFALGTLGLLMVGSVAFLVGLSLARRRDA